MNLYIDSANTAVVRELLGIYPVRGVTTNPSILARENRPPYETLRKLRALPELGELHVQVGARDADGMRREADCICGELGSQTYIKVPVSREGLRAIRILKQGGFRVTATCIYTRMQGYLAAEAGADFGAVYVNRIDHLGEDGAQVAIDLHTLCTRDGYPMRVLGASFKSCLQVQRLAMAGVAAATLPPELFEQMLRLDAVDHALDTFSADLAQVAGTAGMGITCTGC